MRLLFFVCLVALALALPPSSRADDLFSSGKKLFDSGSYPAAVETLQQALAENPENLDISFYLGRAAYEAGDYELAVSAFERVLIMAPDAPRVKLELARAYLKLGSREVARQYFHQVQASNPPEAVWNNIETLLASMEAAERKHFLSGFVTVGLFYDDNVGVFPKSDTIYLNNLPFQLTSTKEGDVGLHMAAGLNHVYRPGDNIFSWKSSLFTYNNLYQDEDDYNLNSVGLSTGPSYQTGGDLLDLQFQAAQVNIDGSSYFDLLGLGANFSHRFGSCFYLNLSTAFQSKNYDQNSDMDAKTWRIGINPVLSSGDNRLSLGLLHEIEEAQDEIFSYDRDSITLRYDRRLPYELAGYGSVRYQKTDYEDPMTLFNLKRADKQTTFEVGLSKTIWRSADHRQSLSLKVSHTYTTVDSNIPLYEYDKNLTLTSMTFAF